MVLEGYYRLEKKTRLYLPFNLYLWEIYVDQDNSNLLGEGSTSCSLQIPSTHPVGVPLSVSFKDPILKAETKAKINVF